MGSWRTSVGEGAPRHFARNYRRSVMTKQCVLCPSMLAPPFFMSTQSLQGPLRPPSSSPCLWASPLLSNSKKIRWRANLVKISTLYTFCGVHILWILSGGKKEWAEEVFISYYIHLYTCIFIGTFLLFLFSISNPAHFFLYLVIKIFNDTLNIYGIFSCIQSSVSPWAILI